MGSALPVGKWLRSHVEGYNRLVDVSYICIYTDMILLKKTPKRFNHPPFSAVPL